MSAHFDNYPDLLVDFATIVGEILAKNGIEEEAASEIAFKAAEQVRNLWGGQYYYLPKGRHYEKHGRDREVWQKFNGHNHRALAEEYNVSQMRIYQIVKRMGATERKRIQPDLFGSSEH